MIKHDHHWMNEKKKIINMQIVSTSPWQSCYCHRTICIISLGAEYLQPLLCPVLFCFNLCSSFKDQEKWQNKSLAAPYIRVKWTRLMEIIFPDKTSEMMMMMCSNIPNHVFVFHNVLTFIQWIRYIFFFFTLLPYICLNIQLWSFKIFLMVGLLLHE